MLRDRCISFHFFFFSGMELSTQSRHRAGTVFSLTFPDMKLSI
jgi:hypothetical protein